MATTRRCMLLAFCGTSLCNIAAAVRSTDEMDDLKLKLLDKVTAKLTADGCAETCKDEPFPDKCDENFKGGECERCEECLDVTTTTTVPLRCEEALCDSPLKCRATYRDDPCGGCAVCCQPHCAPSADKYGWDPICPTLGCGRCHGPNECAPQEPNPPPYCFTECETGTGSRDDEAWVEKCKSDDCGACEECITTTIKLDCDESCAQSALTESWVTICELYKEYCHDCDACLSNPTEPATTDTTTSTVSLSHCEYMCGAQNDKEQKMVCDISYEACKTCAQCRGFRDRPTKGKGGDSAAHGPGAWGLVLLLSTGLGFVRGL